MNSSLSSMVAHYQTREDNDTISDKEYSAINIIKKQV